MAEKGKRVLVFERRNHIGGNLYDEKNDFGILVQKYGPHTFHTNNEAVYAFISNYADWEPYKLRCEVKLLGKCTPSPFNFKTIDQFYSQDKAEELKKRLRRSYSDRTTVTIVELIESHDFLIREYAKFLFKNDYGPYTAKQWGIAPQEVDVSVLKRVPVRMDYQEMYFTDKYECIPVGGFTAFIENLLNHSNIDVVHGDARTIIKLDSEAGVVVFDGISVENDCKLVYTGPIDELFGCSNGVLPYRSLRFEYEKMDIDSYQNAAIVAYPQAEGFTRITECTKLPMQKVGNFTMIAKEYPQKYDSTGANEPYYPILTRESDILYKRYEAEASRYENLILCGRLAEYKYYNMDQAIAAVFEKLP